MADVERTQTNEEIGAAEVAESEERIFVASQWQLMWWRFRKHRLALVSVVVIAIIYTVGLFCEFLATYSPESRDQRYAYAPPQRLRFVDEDGFQLRPFVYALTGERDPTTRRLVFVEDPETKLPVKFFAEGEPYRLWGLFPSNIHLMGVEGEGATLYLLGTDRLGRDQFSRLVYGTRLSTSIGLIGVALSFILGIMIGGFSGYYGGAVDNIVQRSIEFLRAIPTIPLWMGLSAALPPHWSPVRIYFGITVILSLIGWTGLARVVRGRFLSLRQEDFVMAAALAGASEVRIIVRHMVPSFLSHIIASLTLSIPSMILSETALSFLGLGLRPPAISWGVLLQEAQNLRSVALAPWLLMPGLAVVVTVLAFNFMGDGLRDAADPYAR
ncbi:MAG: ABC transporter permease [Anaerolineae bacterium]|nr:ABC transporter permease [Anaerolineae bacterium]